MKISQPLLSSAMVKFLSHSKFNSIDHKIRLKFVQGFLNGSLPIPQKKKILFTNFEYAVEAGDLKILDFFFSDVFKYINKETYTPLVKINSERKEDFLSLALKHGQVEAFKYLISKWPEYLTPNFPGIEAYYDLNFIKYLLAEGFKLDEDENRLLLNSIDRGNLKEVKYLVLQGAKIEVPRLQSYNHLNYSKQLEAVKYLTAVGGEAEALHFYIRSDPYADKSQRAEEANRLLRNVSIMELMKK